MSDNFLFRISSAFFIVLGITCSKVQNPMMILGKWVTTNIYLSPS